MSILSLSLQDNRFFSAEIASALGDINAAVMCDSFSRSRPELVVLNGEPTLKRGFSPSTPT